jgi:peptide/nickel transport system substrate-binding protein
VQIKETLEKFFYAIFLLVFVWVSGQLFFESALEDVVAYAKEGVFGVEEETKLREELRVIFPNDAMSLEPTAFDPAVRQRLVNIYEPLVRPDRDLNMQPALALSWGMLDDLTWEFILRPNVRFHDGSDFGVEDIVASFDRALQFDGSSVKDNLSNLERYEMIGNRFIVKTKVPDPLLLQKISTVLIVPSELAAENQFVPIGTGPYRFVAWKPGESMVLQGFVGHWGRNTPFRRVELVTVVNKAERVNKFLQGEADFLAFVPFDALSYLKGDITVKSIPSLEVQFLLFNFDSPFLNDVENRRIVSMALDQNALADRLGAFAKPVSQFVSNGVFGYNPDIDPYEFDTQKAKSLAAKTGLSGKTLQFHLPLGLDVLGEHVRQQLNDVGVNVIVSYLEPADFMESLQTGKADIYFLAVKSDLGDAMSFLEVIAHSNGEFNVGNYDGKRVDDLIDSSLRELDLETRLAKLQEAMKIVVIDDVMGLPLFEYDQIYAYHEGLEFEPRIDGLVYFNEIK